jgi:hypothetical protein
MRSYWITLSLLSILFSCSSDSSNSVALFNGVEFKLLESELVSKKNFASNDTYVLYFNNDSTTQIPLFHYIKGYRYEVFIGTPLSSDLNALASSFQKDSIIRTESGADFVFVQAKKNNSFITKYLVKTDSASLIGVFVKTETAALSDSLFTQKKISERFYKK